VTSTLLRQRAGTDVRPWIGLGARLLLGGLLLVTGALKVVDPQSSVRAVRAYELLSEPAAVVVGWALPFGEILLGLLLVTGTLTSAAATAAAALLVVFILALVSAWARGLSIDCGCFGGGGPVADGESAYGRAILRDLGLLITAGWLVAYPRTRFAVDNGYHPPIPGAEREAVR
jgi:uncharacterized membrane protein YphA (DoxX/SURF4 family)